MGNVNMYMYILYYTYYLQPQPAHAAIKLTNEIKTNTYYRKYKIVLRVLDRAVYCAGDQEK